VTHLRAVLFDFGGTLYDYRTLESAERDSLVDLARWSDIDADPRDIQRAHRDAMRQVFRSYLPRPFYRHRDLFRDAVVGMLDTFGVRAQPEHLERYRMRQWERHAASFALRPGVTDTLATLRARGLHLGLVSNIDDDQLDHLLDLAGIRPMFDSVVSSERAGSCKPHRGIFDLAVQQAGCSPGQAAFVGDTVAQDIAGANAVGMYSVLLWHRLDREPPTEPPRPHHVIRSISELVDLVDREAV
jgi:putative hydrolase of the HAD superfamily